MAREKIEAADKLKTKLSNQNRKPAKAPASGLNPNLPETPPNQSDAQLIPVTQGVIGGVTGLVVDARKLHAHLGSARGFSNWMAYKIKSFGFVGDVDYTPIKNRNVFNSLGRGRPEVEYTLTLDMAKELAMVEKNAQGRAVRRYFIDCERNLLKAAAAKPAPDVASAPIPAHTQADAYSGTFVDLNGKHYEKNAGYRHQAMITQVFAEIPRKAAYLEYARTLAVVGEDQRALAEQVAECVYKKLLIESLKKILSHPELLSDLRAIKGLLEGSDENGG